MDIADAIKILNQTAPPDGNYKAWNRLKAESLERLAQATSPEVTHHLGALRDLIVLSSDVYKMRAAALVYVRSCLERADPDSILTLLPLITYKQPVLAALAAANESHDLWPLLERQLAMPTDPALEIELVSLLCLALRKDEGSPEHTRKFERLTALSPRVAARTGEALARENPVQIEGLKETLVALAIHPDESVASCAQTSLRLAADHGIKLGELPRIEAALDDVNEATREALVALLTSSRVNDLPKQELVPTLAADLASPRVEVRRGVVRALLSASHKRKTLWSLVLHAMNDAEASVRHLALEAAKARATEHTKWLPNDDQFRALLTGTSEASSDDVLAYLLLAAAKAPERAQGWLLLLDALPSNSMSGALRGAIVRHAERRPSRACDQCRGLGRTQTWNHDLSAPKGLATLEVAKGTTPEDDGLRHCTSCGAYFVYNYECEYDVNSKHESHSLTRLTKREATKRYPNRIDATHPRWAVWEAALTEDLDHLDATVRANAAWEIVKDACAEKLFTKVEETLLHHPDPEVIAEGLSALADACGLDACPVTRDTLQALSRHRSPSVQRPAAYLLVMQQAADRSTPLDWVFETDAACDGQAAAVSRLVAAGMTLSANAAFPLLSSALRAKRSTRYTLHALCAEAVLNGPQGDACCDRILDALTSNDHAIQNNAFALAGQIPAALLASEARLTRVLSAHHTQPEKVTELVLLMVQAGAPLSSAAPIVEAALANPAYGPQQQAVLAIDAALTRGESSEGLFGPLCELCDRVRNAYAAMTLVKRWSSTIPVPTKGLSILQRIVDTGIGSFHDDCVRAVMTLHLRAQDEPAALALLHHRLASVRGIAAGQLGAAQTKVGEAMRQRLAEMAASDESYPRGEATRALAALNQKDMNKAG